MRNVKEILLTSNTPLQPWHRSPADHLLAELETNGIVVLPSIVGPEQLRGMQLAFESQLQRVRWNNFEGHRRTELYRDMVEDVLLFDQGFVDLALHPLVKEIVSRNLDKAEAAALPLADHLVELTGAAGTVFMFDTSAIHRQSIPILEPRQAIFYGYHDPRVPLQPDDIAYYRYHPLLLNAAFLGGLSPEDQRILGFGNKTNFQAAFQRRDQPPLTYRVFETSHEAGLYLK